MQRLAPGGGAWILAALLLGLGCATAQVPLATPAQQQASRRFEPPPGRALLYVIRPHMGIGRLGTLFATLDGGVLGSLPVGHYIATELEPGLHDVGGSSVVGRVGMSVPIEVEAGGLYFVSIHFVMRGLSAREVVQQVAEEDGRTYVQQFQMVQSL